MQGAKWQKIEKMLDETHILPLADASLAHISGRECKNTSPSKPPTAKLSNRLRVFAFSEIEKKNV